MRRACDHGPGDDDGVRENEIRTNTYYDWSEPGMGQRLSNAGHYDLIGSMAATAITDTPGQLLSALMDGQHSLVWSSAS